MNKIKFIISTPYGNRYELSKEGYVLRYSNGLDNTKSSREELKTWQVMGIRKIKAFGNLGSLISLDEAVKIKEFQFKNGKPRYTIQDLDHGTIRIVGNWNVHGVKNVYLIN